MLPTQLRSLQLPFCKAAHVQAADFENKVENLSVSSACKVYCNFVQDRLGLRVGLIVTVHARTICHSSSARNKYSVVSIILGI